MRWQLCVYVYTTVNVWGWGCWVDAKIGWEVDVYRLQRDRKRALTDNQQSTPYKNYIVKKKIGWKCSPSHSSPFDILMFSTLRFEERLLQMWLYIWNEWGTWDTKIAIAYKGRQKAES